MKPVRLAVIGGGHLGYIHTKLARENPGFRIVAVCDPQPLVQQRVIQEFDLRAVSNWMKIIGEFDAAIVATPTATHHEIASELIRHGVHLLIEKPVAASLREAEELVALAAEHRVATQIGHVECFHPLFQKVRELVGQPQFVRAARHSGYTFRSTDISVVYDLMIHDLDLAAELLGGETAAVAASGTTLFGPHPDIAEARIAFAGGGHAVLSASRCDQQPCRRMQVFGSAGMVELDFNNRSITGYSVPASWPGQRDAEDFADPSRQKWYREHLFTEVFPARQLVVEAANAIALEQADWLRSIRTGEPALVPASRGLRAVQMAAAVDHAVRQCAWNQPVQRATASPPELLPLPTRAKSARRKAA
jgi:predicted dehydrogenase